MMVTKKQLLAHAFVGLLLWWGALYMFAKIGGWRMVAAVMLLTFSINLSEWVREHQTGGRP